MQINCPNKNCVAPILSSPKIKPIVSNGSFFRSSDSRVVKRFLCRSCKTYFSQATLHPCYRQKKRRINAPLKILLCSGVSQRRAAHILKVNPKTVVRHFRFLADQARREHEAWLKRYEQNPLNQIQFDDLETSEHTKCKPVSVALAIDPIHRKILNFEVAQMPAKGHLVRLAFKKYGKRPDKRPVAWNSLMQKLKPIVKLDASWLSDENPHYPPFLFKHHPHAKHSQTKGGRGSIAGQGELKKLRFDPLFALNHTCAMLRANLNRLFRKTWCTTKTLQGLSDHLAIYVCFHNTVLTATSAGKGGSWKDIPRLKA